MGGVVGLADLYVDPALGFSLGWAAWVSPGFSSIDWPQIEDICHAAFSTIGA